MVGYHHLVGAEKTQVSVKYVILPIKIIWPIFSVCISLKIKEMKKIKFIIIWCSTRIWHSSRTKHLFACPCPAMCTTITWTLTPPPAPWPVSSWRDTWLPVTRASPPTPEVWTRTTTPATRHAWASLTPPPPRCPWPTRSPCWTPRPSTWSPATGTITTTTTTSMTLLSATLKVLLCSFIWKWYINNDY